jgi:hypothetical protein
VTETSLAKNITSRDVYDKYTTLNLEQEGIKKELVTATQAPSNIKRTLIPPETTVEAVLAEVEGVILGMEEDYVKVKLLPDTYASFPRVLFAEETFMRRGQHIKYLIKRDKEGYRYQEIIPTTEVMAHPEKEKVLKLLDEFKYRDE